MGKKSNRMPAASSKRAGSTWTNAKGDRWKVALKVVKERAQKKKYWKKISSCRCVKKCKCRGLRGCRCGRKCRCSKSSFGKKMARRTGGAGTPAVSAKSLPVRTIRRGRDGQRYIVVIRSNGKGWKKTDRTSASRTGRKSPSDSASMYRVGTRKRGNDGRMWIIRTATRNGRKYRVWRRLGFGNPVLAARALKIAAANPKLTKKIAKKAKRKLKSMNL